MAVSQRWVANLELRKSSQTTPPTLLRWARDGTALTYSVDRQGVSNIYSQSLAGGAARQVTDFSSEVIFSFDWSPDGQRLVCSRGAITSDAVVIAGFR